MTAYNMYEAGDSPECTLPVKNITGFSFNFACYEHRVIISIGLYSKLSPIFYTKQ
jgi:hypothetical protein